MPEIRFNQAAYPVQEDESVLDCLLRHEQSIPHACKSGVCQACLVKAVNNDAPDRAKKALKPTLQAQGYALACQWVPNAHADVSLPSLNECSVAVSIRSIEPLNHRTVRVRLDVVDGNSMFEYFPGQYLTISNTHGVSRSYSIANNFTERGCIELHVQKMPQGQFTEWLFSDAKPGDVLHVRGPAGDCFYINAAQEDFPILLAGTGTGLAPLYGILHEALRHGHRGTIQLFHGGFTARDLYCVNELRELSLQYPQFRYHPSSLHPSEEVSGAVDTGALDEVILRHLDPTSLASTRVYLCGAPELVHQLRKKICLKGAKSGNIYCDPFIERKVAAAA